MKKGFVFSMDSVFALSVLLLLLTSSTRQLSLVSFTANEESYLEAFSEDMLVSLEKSGKLENAVRSNTSSQLNSFLRESPTNICTQLELLNSTGSLVVLSTEIGCSNYTRQVHVSFRTFVVGNNFYIARLKSWHKER